MKYILILFILGYQFLSAESIKIHSPLSSLNIYKFQTPQDEFIEIPKDTQLIVIAFDKATGRLTNEYFSTLTKDYLQNNHIVYIADIHQIPSIIASLFVLPKMKEYKYTIYLNYDEEFEKEMPKEEEKITLLKIENGLVQDIVFIATQEELQTSIEKN